MGIRKYLALPFMSLLALCSFAACESEETASGTLCDPGSNVFCRCRGGAPGTKHCADAGEGFGECESADGTCDEVDPSGGSTGSGDGPPGGDPPQPEGELLGPCTEDSDCKDGMTCPLGYCTMTCSSYEDCSDAVGDCVNWEGSPICMPYCVTQEHCEAYGLASRCGYTDDSLPSFDVLVCANWGDNLQLPPDGFPPGVACDDDRYCHLGFEEVERVCDVDGCVDGCHIASDCGDGQMCSSSGTEVGTCGGMMMENGDDCPGIPLSISLQSPDVMNVTGDTSQAPPPSEHEIEMGSCFGPGEVPSEELIYAVSVVDDGTLIIDLSTTDMSYDPQMYARLDNCQTGMQLTCADDGIEGEGEIFEIVVFQGETIYLFVDGYQGSSGSFTLNLNLSP
jgi:hypothetical protein